MSNRFSLNVAKLICPPEGPRNVRWEHYCKIELPWHLGALGAMEQAEEIRDHWYLIGHWNFTLTEWVEEGHDIWDKKKLCGPDPMWIYPDPDYPEIGSGPFVAKGESIMPEPFDPELHSVPGEDPDDRDQRLWDKDNPPVETEERWPNGMLKVIPYTLEEPEYLEPVANDPDYTAPRKPDPDELRDYGPDYYPETPYRGRGA